MVGWPKIKTQETLLKKLGNISKENARVMRKVVEGDPHDVDAGIRSIGLHACCGRTTCAARKAGRRRPIRPPTPSSRLRAGGKPAEPGDGAGESSSPGSPAPDDGSKIALLDERRARHGGMD